MADDYYDNVTPCYRVGTKFKKFSPTLKMWCGSPVVTRFLDTKRLVSATCGGKYTRLNTMSEDTVWNSSIFGELEILKKLCEDEEAPIHEADDRGFTPLCWAARNGHNPVLTYLIDKKCSMEQGSFAGMKPLHHACNKNLESTVKLLLAAGAEVTWNLFIPLTITTCHLTHTLITTQTPSLR